MATKWEDLTALERRMFEHLVTLVGNVRCDTVSARRDLAEQYDIRMPEPEPTKKSAGIRPAASIRPQAQRQNPVPTWLDLIDEALGWCDDLPEAGAEFGESVSQKLQDMRDTIEDRNCITPAQETAIINIREGLKKWMH